MKGRWIKDQINNKEQQEVINESQTNKMAKKRYLFILKSGFQCICKTRTINENCKKIQ